MYNPVSTYRIQFHKGFNFKQFEQIIPYLSKLGIKTIYASPIFKATPGSNHGYDITDPLTINPEIGTLRELRSINKKLKKMGIGWLQDIVPNHMAFHPDNVWLMDVLKNGQQSRYASYFDILWDIPGMDGKLMVPFLGKSFDDALAANEIEIINDNDFQLSYMGQHYPLNQQSLKLIPNAQLKEFNKDHDLIKKIAAVQYYRLCSWEETNQHINYRRFFTVNGLICLNMQDIKVFDAYHKFIVKLLKEGIFQGLRVDHIDGLYDPETYLNRLRERVGNEAYIVVEKILETGEKFPDWPMQGNTGYDMLSLINNLFTNKKSKKELSAFYQSLSTGKEDVGQRIFDKKRLILNNYMPGELENLYQLFIATGLTDEHKKVNGLKDAIAEFMISFPTYRLYGHTFPLPANDSKMIHQLVKKLKHVIPHLSDAVRVIEDALLNNTTQQPEKTLKFYQRLMQFTGPLMAKGVEDTLMYTYNRFIDHNEVGDSPASFGLKPKAFHKAMQDRITTWPMSVIATATHDTKRGEDVRSRLNVLSDMAEDWIENVTYWQELNVNFKTDNYPDANDEYFIYQTIAGALPMPGQDYDDFSNRLNEYLVKALREGKVNSDWAKPNEQYEDAAKEFAGSVIDQVYSSPFFKQLADYGIVNSLAQVLIKYTLPGIPDLYQGCEFWDLSLVDPDNRRPVDHKKHAALLNAIKTENIQWDELWKNRYNGTIKQQLTRLLLNQRKEYSDLFTSGAYIPLKIKGRYKKNVFAFARQLGKEWMVTIVPLHLASIIDHKTQSQQFDWDDTGIQLPGNAPHYWQNIFGDEGGYAATNIPVKSVFKKLPIALVKLSDKGNKRGAGILMHITSLPSNFGVGDLGSSAYQFADFLFASGQKYWQLLPVNPVDKHTDFSPYSSTSAMAGNTMLISPELLTKSNWLNNIDISKYDLKSTGKANLEQAEMNKQTLFVIAYNNFITSGDIELTEQFSAFKSKEDYWLHDFALYEVLKSRYNGKAWYKWPKMYRQKDVTALKNIAAKQEKDIDKAKWLQWIFTRQWAELKAYCDNKNITFLGDMPFYISYDSVDVWANPQLFKLDKKGNMAGIAGVPPDYFSADGQLWGMPVYNWAAHKSKGYQWWINRIKKNLEYFDIIRLDHFRAFSAYWEVPAGSDTAVNGKWQSGPGIHFFEAVKSATGCLPFIAEDLGDISDDVYKLRDTFNLPGMHVLQFAFDETMPVSPHIPHNYATNSVAYTGTHDNNTILGWFTNDVNRQTKKMATAYTGKKITSKNINEEFIKLCYASVANIVIIPMQDILGLGKEARMNNPSTQKENWRWRMESDHELKQENPQLLKWISAINR